MCPRWLRLDEALRSSFSGQQTAQTWFGQYKRQTLNVVAADVIDQQPMPPWSWVFGHLAYFRRYQKRYPSDLFVSVIVSKMCAEFRDTDLFYLDLWPFSAMILIVNDPEVAMHISSGKHVYSKSRIYPNLIDPLIGGPNILTMDGEEWKKWRTIFNPAFSQSYLMQQIPVIIDKAEIFCSRMNERHGQVFQLEDLATRMTVDLIIKVAL
jgi:cytochrome P450